jgi:hypothetical protein
MSESLAVRAEILKLARLLRREPADLEYLAEVSAADIRQIREQVTDVLWGAHGHALARLAAGSKILPVSLVATLGERVFGPVLSARIAGLLDPDRAVEMAARLPTPFLADIAVELDPRRASEVISRIPPPQIAAITSELIGRDEYVTMGRFVGHLTPAAITAAVEVMDDRSLLHVAFVLESKASLKDLIGVLPPPRLDGIVRAAATENLWPEVLDLLAHLTLEQRRAIVERAAAWDDGSTLSALLSAAEQEGMWAELLPLVPLLPEEGRQRVAEIVGGLELDDDAVRLIATAVIENDLWDPVLTIAEHMPEPELQRIVSRLVGPVATMDAEERESIAQRARAAGLMDRLGPLGEALLDGRGVTRDGG